MISFFFFWFIGLTFAGDTSGIITNGIGPRPTAKDLHESSHSGSKKVLMGQE